LLPQGPESTFHYYYYHLRVMKLTSKGLYCGSFVLLLERGAKTREGRVSYLQLSLGPLKIKRPTVPRLFSYPDSNLVVAPLMMLCPDFGASRIRDTFQPVGTFDRRLYSFKFD